MGTVDCDPEVSGMNPELGFERTILRPLEGGQKKAMVLEPWLNLYFSTYHLN